MSVCVCVHACVRVCVCVCLHVSDSITIMQLIDQVTGVQMIILSMHISNYHLSSRSRPFPIDMAGFAINLCLLMQHPTVVIGKNRDNKLSKAGYLESNLLEQLIEKEELECRGPEDEVGWITHTLNSKKDVCICITVC